MFHSLPAINAMVNSDLVKPYRLNDILWYDKLHVYIENEVVIRISHAYNNIYMIYCTVSLFIL